MDDKQKKVENGRFLFDEYQKKKHSTLGRPEDFCSSAVKSSCEAKHGVLATERTAHDINSGKMDATTLQKSTENAMSLGSKIKHLTDVLSEKNEIIESLKIENNVLRKGTGDHHNVPSEGHDKRMVQHLQLMVEGRDTYISQLSESLQNRSQELTILLEREKALTTEKQALQQEMNDKIRHSDLKLAESYNETIEYKAKVEVLSSQAEEYAAMVNSLRTSLESSSKKLESKEDELVLNGKKLTKYKNETSEEIKNLMRQVEELNYDVAKKEKELIKSRKEVESLRREQEERFGGKIKALKEELEKKYKEDVTKVELLYDGMLLEHIRKSDVELNAIKKCGDLEAQISTCRITYEEETNLYKEELKKLLERNKSAEEHLLQELDKYKQDADHYRQQVENFENKLSEEVQKIKHDCRMELSKYEAEIVAFKASSSQEKIQYYTEEIDKLCVQLKNHAIDEAKKEVEIETYRDELKKSADQISTLVENLSRFKETCEKLQNQLSAVNVELNQCKECNSRLEANLHEFQENERQLLQELKDSKEKLHNYEQQVCEFNKKQQSESNEKYTAVVQTFQEQIQTLMRELEHNKAQYAEDVLSWTSQANIQQNEIENLEAKLLYILRTNKANITETTNIDGTHRDFNSFYDQTGQISICRQNAMVGDKMRESNKEFLIGILNGLRGMKAYIHNLVSPNGENTPENLQIIQSEENTQPLSCEVITEELEKTMGDLINMTQFLHLDADGHVSFVVPPHEHLNFKSSNMITSTPNIKKYHGDNECGAAHKLPTEYSVHESDNNINGWMRKCARLENENEKLTRELELLTASLKEMEYCLVVASKESTSFNKKCQVFDAKITELEQSKLSAYMLKKENNELKERLISMEELELKLREDLQVIHEKNINLEQILNNSIEDLYNKLSRGGSNEQLESMLANFKEKSDEVISLKSQLVFLQKTENNHKLRILDIQSKYQHFLSKYECLTAELNTKKKELEDVWEERNKISSERNFLQTKLLSIQEETNYHNLKASHTSCNEYASEIAHSEKSSKAEKTAPIPRRLESSGTHRHKTAQALSATHSLDKTNSAAVSVAEQINYQLQLLDQEMEETLEYHMPTILEEEDQEEDSLCLRQVVHGQLPQDVNGLSEKSVPQGRASLVHGRCQVALRQLLSALFDEYTSSMRKLVLPWKEEFETLHFNLHKDLDNSTNNTSLSKENHSELLYSDLDKSTNNESSSEENHSESLQSDGCDKDSEAQNNIDTALLHQDSLKKVTEDCITSLFYMKKRLVSAHNAILKSINVQKEQLEKGCLLIELQEQVINLQAEKTELEKKHTSAIELLIKDHDNELSLVNSLLVKLQKMDSVRVESEDCEAIRKDLEQKHRKEVEELRLYFEKKCADLEKHYSEEIYSQSQQSCKVSVSSSSSDIENMVDLYYTGEPDEEELPQIGNEEKIHEGCEKRITDLKELLQNMQEKSKRELESVKADYEVCKMCRKNTVTNGEEQRSKQLGTTLEQYYTEKIKELGDNYSSSNMSKDLELKVYQIKEEVRKDYESEIDKIREEIIAKELKRKDEEINTIREQLNQAHKIEVEKLWKRYEELANKEVENSVIRVKNEVVLSQELQDKAKLIEQLKIDNKELLKKLKTMTELKQKEVEQLKNELNKAHKKESENMKQAFEIELTTRIDTILEEKAEMEEKFKNKIERFQDIVSKIHSEKVSLQEGQKQEAQSLTDSVRKDILRALELQIKAMVASGDEGQDKSQWPPELAALERQFTSKYQRQLAQLVEEHALEIADIKAEYDTKLSDLIKEYSIKQAEEMPMTILSTGDQDLDKIVRERDNLRNLALTLRQVVRELARYLTTCEDELNKSIVGELLKLASPHKVQITALEGESSDSEVERSLVTHKRVHFAPDVSSIVTLMDEDYLFDCLEHSVDLSVHFRSELESCLDRLRGEAAAVLGLTQARDKALPSTVEDRRLSSITRQLIEEKKAKEEANVLLQNMQELLNKYEKELNDVHKELAETKERMIKEKVAAETELDDRETQIRIQKLCLLQEKARSLLSEKGDCPPVWLGLIEELCVEGDCLIEEAYRARDELQSEVEAADKQLRSTRAFLEEQASEREQERDEFTKEITRLTELLREKDRDWTSHKHFATEWAAAPVKNIAATCTAAETVEALEQQLKDTAELLKDTEEKKVKVEKELKAAVDKIWVLRDIISELEVQVSSRCEREAGLERRLAELEAELNQQALLYTDLQQELRTLRDSGADQTQLQELASLREQLRKQASPVLVRQMKSQLRQMAKSLDRQIKELEAVNIHVSSASLSSPSEDVSIREQLEALRCATPEGLCNGSPPSHQPVEEINQLGDKLLRYSRAAENIIKKLRDREMEMGMLRNQSEEVQAERDVLQAQSERQLLQLAALHNRVEELRVRNEREIKANTAPLQQCIQELEKQTKDLTDELNISQRKLTKMKQKLDRSEALVQTQEAEISSLSDYQQELVDKLRQDLATMIAEKQQMQAMVEKYRMEESASFPQVIEVMMAEKNADIDQLQLRVEELQSQQEQQVSKSQSQHFKSRGFRVSFADDVAHSRLKEGERAREAYQHHDASSIKPYFSTPLSSIVEGGNKIVPRVIGEDLSKITEPTGISLTSPPNRAVQLESALSQLKSELEQKTQRLLECEAQLRELPLLEQELTETKEKLVETVKAVSEDKRFYEERLRTLSHTQQLLAEREVELREVRAELSRKEEDVVKTTADVRALQLIMEGLQQKLQEAKTFAATYEENSSVHNQLQELKGTNNRYKDECDTFKKQITSLEEQLSSLSEALVGEKRARQTLQETVDKLEKDKQNILSEVVMTKSKCKSLQEELETALKSAKEKCIEIQSLSSDLEVSLSENKNLNETCQRLKKEMEHLTKKQKTELKNILTKDSEEAIKMKKELESLKSSNSELQSACDSLQQELNEVGSNLELLRELNNKDDKIQQLETELKQLDEDNRTLKEEKGKTEESLSTEIFELKVLIDGLNKNIESLETESKDSQDGIQGREQKESLVRRYDSLKREYDRQRRARREVEKKCTVLKDELAKEKRFSARLQNGVVDKRVPELVIAKANIVDIRSDGVKLTKSLDNLTDEVQKELNASAELDQSLISGLQQSSEREDVPRSESMPPRVDYLTERLAEVETALHVEQVVVSELRARLTDERALYLAERARAHHLSQEVSTLHTLNDQFEDKFKSIAYQLEQQVNEVKELRHHMEPEDRSLKEKDTLKKLVEENQRRVEELLQERLFNKNQLLYLREELAKLMFEREAQLQTQSHGQGDNRKKTSVDSLQLALECRIKELEQEQRKSKSLQRMLDQATQTLDKQTQQLSEAKELNFKINDLKIQLSAEVELRRSLEAKIKAMELAERARHIRRKTAEEKLKEVVAHAEKAKKDLERECLGLQLKLKQSRLQLTAHTAESPLSLRLTEANMAVERLVGEKEDLISANTHLKEEKEELQRRLRQHEELIEDLKSRIHALNIKVTDGGLDNLNAMFAAERAAWLKEKETLKLALMQSHSATPDSFNSYGNAAHILQRYLRAENHRNALVWQKRYLLVANRCYQEEEKHTIAALSRFPPPPPPPPPSAEHKFRVAVCVVRAVSRLQFLVEHRRRAHENTCRLLQHALNNNRLPHRVDKVPELQTLWRKTDIVSTSSSVQPGSLSGYLERFNTMQDRIKNTLSSAS